MSLHEHVGAAVKAYAAGAVKMQVCAVCKASAHEVRGVFVKRCELPFCARGVRQSKYVTCVLVQQALALHGLLQGFGPTCRGVSA